MLDNILKESNLTFLNLKTISHCTLFAIDILQLTANRCKTDSKKGGKIAHLKEVNSFLFYFQNFFTVHM